jgi:tetratricopeptide (TPR) repeat protein
VLTTTNLSLTSFLCSVFFTSELWWKSASNHQIGVLCMMPSIHPADWTLTQAVLPWDAGTPRKAIDLLEYGFTYRTWDWYIPFFLSFDYAFFLKDYRQAGEYLTKAAELNPRAAWFSTLAARYFYEGDRTALAIAYLEELIPTARNAAIKKQLITRAEALERILQIEEAINTFRESLKRTPENLEELVKEGFLVSIPEDPYGGIFYLDERGKVRTTSKLALGKRNRGANKD